MSDTQNVTELEAALVERAERLAAEYLGRGRDGHDAILKEKRQRLRVREERLSEEAEAHAERLYRRHVQAARLRLQADLDRRRWALIQSVLDDLPTHFKALRARESTYHRLLQQLLARAAESVGDDEIVAALSARDIDRLQDRWDAFCEQATPGKTVSLDSEPLRCSGGVLVTNADDTVRVDATFEGRVQRYRDELVHTIAGRLFADDDVETG